MQRRLLDALKRWKQDQHRLPLILRGARQVGKSHLITQFGEEHFKQCMVINFEYQPLFCNCFEGELAPEKILQQLELLSNKRCIPGETLLFFDEIQECPKAILSLRYFKELLPELHVIAAGSLLEFTLAEAEFRFPVGRVSFLYLRPLSFKEFLQSLGQDQLLNFLAEVSLAQASSFPMTVHQQLLDLVRQYCVIGGMPGVIAPFIESRSYLEAKHLQQQLVQTYIQDFGKYASRAQQKYLQRLIQVAPTLIGKQFKYSSVDPEMKAREIKRALEQLQWAGILQTIHATSASGLPLEVGMKDKVFKLLFLDIGLMHQYFGVNTALLLERNTTLLHWGNLMEQFVGQELDAYQDPHIPATLFYWQRDAKGAVAEVDHVISMHNHLFPIEVKAGKTGQMKSMMQFLKEKPSPFGIRISELPLNWDKTVLSVPFYLIHELERLVKEAL